MKEKPRIREISKEEFLKLLPGTPEQYHAKYWGKNYKSKIRICSWTGRKALDIVTKNRYKNGYKPRASEAGIKRNCELAYGLKGLN